MVNKKYQARPLQLPPNRNHRKTLNLKRPARTWGINVELCSKKFTVPLGAPTEPVVAAFNKMLVQMYNLIADLKELLEEVNGANPQFLQSFIDQVNHAHPELIGPENKEGTCSFLRKGINGLRTKACGIRCFMVEVGWKPLNEPLDWSRT